MKKTLFIIFSIVLIIAVSCASVENPAPGVASRNTSFTITNSEIPMYAHSIGGNLTVKVDGNPTTGYEWTVKGTDVIKVVSSEYEADNTSGLVGAGGTYEFSFKTIKAGEATLVFNYGRSWESSPAATFSVRVVVDENLTITELEVLWN
ncbi:MAG: protease inhibitor I42 family protein [Sphaerochaetaceae bacterium]|nr:protease inhibitor I42 family protein [Sphaerochaetaceae bacterium]